MQHLVKLSKGWIEDTEKIENDITGKLKENITIESATVETFGQEFKVIKNKDK